MSCFLTSRHVEFERREESGDYSAWSAWQAQIWKGEKILNLDKIGIDCKNCLFIREENKYSITLIQTQGSLIILCFQLLSLFNLHYFGKNLQQKTADVRTELFMRNLHQNTE